MSDRGQLLAVAGFVIALTGCADEHPAYDLEFLEPSATLAQTSQEPSERAVGHVELTIRPTAAHSESWITLETTERFPSGFLRAYEPSDNRRFEYHERLPVLTLPAVVADDPLRIGEAETIVEVRAQVSNLELRPLCGERVVFVPEFLIWSEQPEPAAEREFDFEATRPVELTAATRVECL